MKQQCDSYFEVQYVSSHICDVFHLHLVFPEMDSLRCITEKIQITAESSCDKTIIYTCKLDNTTLLGFSYSSRAVQLVVYKPIQQLPNSRKFKYRFYLRGPCFHSWLPHTMTTLDEHVIKLKYIKYSILFYFFIAVTCYNDIYGFGKVDDTVKGDCEKNKVGFREGVCGSNGFWETVKDTCVLRIIEQLEQESQVCFSILLPSLLFITQITCALQ